MEILSYEPVKDIAWWTIAVLIIGTISLISFLIMWANEIDIGTVIFGIITFACIAIVFFTPSSIETEKIKYTVEITEEEQYRHLINADYKFKKLYDNREIYEITGDPLEVN